MGDAGGPAEAAPVRQVGQPFRKSTLGVQAESKMRTNPQWTFGSEERPGPTSYDTAHTPGPVYRVHASAGSVRRPPAYSFGVSYRSVIGGRDEGSFPGPGQYRQNDSVGRQSNSRMHSYANWKFGTSTREDQSKVFLGADAAKSVPEFIHSPGPAVYNSISSMSTQRDSRKPSSENFGFGSSMRFHDAPKTPGAANGFPSPAAYSLHSAVGKQISSVKSSYPVNSFPLADRYRTAAVQYLGRQFVGAPRVSPGPAVYSLNDSVGTQVSSTRRSSGKFGFGTADRFGYQDISIKQADTPGPGSYSM